MEPNYEAIKERLVSHLKQTNQDTFDFERYPEGLYKDKFVDYVTIDRLFQVEVEDGYPSCVVVDLEDLREVDQERILDRVSKELDSIYSKEKLRKENLEATMKDIKELIQSNIYLKLPNGDSLSNIPEIKTENFENKLKEYLTNKFYK